MTDLLEKFEGKAPEIVFEWHDSETEAKGWVVINSLRNGAAGGGTRMRPGLDKNEVLSLAKTMEVKFTVSGPPIGGAKSGIDFDPRDPRKEGVLKRWYQAVIPLLKNYYGTGGDLNIDEVAEVIPVTESFGLWHPQEGVVNGHYKANDPSKIKKIGQLRQGVKKVLEDPEFVFDGNRHYTVADMITGFGVAEAVRHYYGIWGGNITTKKAIIQGWGNVGASAACYLAKYGVKIVGIIDRDGGLLNPEGFGLEEIKALFMGRDGNKLNARGMLSFNEMNQRIWGVGAEIFIPAAASRLVTRQQLEQMIHGGLEVVSCGANVPFNDPEIFTGPTTNYADQQVALIPDFIANCGMARVFAYLMGSEVEMTDAAIFTDTSETIKNALTRTHSENPQKVNLTAAAMRNALLQLV